MEQIQKDILEIMHLEGQIFIMQRMIDKPIDKEGLEFFINLRKHRISVIENRKIEAQN